MRRASGERKGLTGDAVTETHGGHVGEAVAVERVAGGDAIGVKATETPGVDDVGRYGHRAVQVGLAGGSRNVEITEPTRILAEERLVAAVLGFESRCPSPGVGRIGQERTETGLPGGRGHQVERPQI